MGTVESIRQVAEIARRGGAVVVSASSGTTDQLIALGKAALGAESFEEGLMALMARHAELVAGLGVATDLSVFDSRLRAVLSGELSMDEVQSFGERMSARILADYLVSIGVDSEAIDAFELVRTDDNFGEGNVDFEKSYELISARVLPLVEAGVVPVITGFIGQSASGKYIILGRGGSDYSGAIVAGAVSAEELEIWTDVDGILNADPRLIARAKVLSQLSYNEAGELAYFGAKVLHPKTILPATSKGIPVRIVNTFNVEATGTVISAAVEESLKSVTYRKGVSIVNIYSLRMLDAHGFLARIFAVFARHNVVVDVVTTSEVSVSATVDGVVSEDLVKELREFANVEVESGLAIVCLVGEGIRSRGGLLGELFSAVAEHDVAMVSQGASKRNVTFLVAESEAAEVVTKIFNKFFQ